MQGLPSTTTNFVFSYLQHGVCTRFSALSLHQRFIGHKQTIYEKLDIPPKPKKPESPFLKFLKEVRPSLLREHPGVKSTELVKMAAQKWNIVDSTLKEKLIQQCKGEFIEYNKILSKYENNLTTEQKAEIKREKQHRLDVKEDRRTKKKAKELGKPKQPLSIFVKYLSSRSNDRDKYPSQRDFILAVAEDWKTVSPEIKLKLQNERKQEYEKFTRELKAWEEKMIKGGNLDVIRSSSLLPPSKKKLKT